MKRLMRCAGCVVLPALLAAAIGLLWASQQLLPASESPRPIKVVIAQGAAPRDIGRQLARQGIIRSELAFLWVAARRGKLSALKSGGYELSPDMTLPQIIDRLTRGGVDVSEVPVTIPEGYTLAQIAETLKSKGIVKAAADFTGVAESGASKLEIPFSMEVKSLEGYLYPETYRFAPGTESEAVAESMLRTFYEDFYQPNENAIRRSGHSLHELVTIASLVEREARVDKDRARIAGVIENRLKKGMRLEIDASVLYALGRHKNRVLYRDLNVESPYNTYRNTGLPPGPIANPGKESLMAALNPEKHGFYFYVAAPDGSHTFTRTLSDHNRQKARIRALRRNPTSPDTPT